MNNAANVAPVPSGKPKLVIAPVLMQAEKLREERKLDEALTLTVRYMNEHFDDIPALTMAAHILIDAERHGLAQPLMLLASKLAPDEGIIWNNLGLCYLEAAQLDKAEACFIKALSRDPGDVTALSNLAKLYNDIAQPQKAINCAEKALRLEPRLPEANYNRGQSYLFLKRWKEGWEGYEHNLGRHQGRRERVYGQIPRWTGVDGMTLIAYGEQGIGDEINFASCIPDLMKKNTVIIECEERLAGLFRRSFGCDTYGTRYIKGGISWPTKYQIDASVAFGSLPGFYRNTDADFPGTPYLIADPQRRLQWKVLLATLGDKPKVGITWTGGLKKTGTVKRSVALNDLLPILKQDATFISLQYKDAAEEIAALEAEHGIKVHQWPHATLTRDYDDTAALVAELDLVITVQQSAVHLAGGLGVPTWVMLPKFSLWRYGLAGDTMPWYGSVRIYRQTQGWVDEIAEVARDLRKYCFERKGAVTPHVVPDNP